MTNRPLPTIRRLATFREYPSCVFILANVRDDIYLYDIQNMRSFGENTPQYDFACRVEKYGQEYLERCLVAPRSSHATDLVFIEFSEPKHDMILGGVYIDFPHDVFENSRKLDDKKLEEQMMSSISGLSCF